jgi:bifunctional non-homologous end joining protein LigD
MVTKKKSRAEATEAVDQQLKRYRSMRDFDLTAEPSGNTKSSRKSSPMQYPFVIHKHAASHLHYDFRLGWNGVLKSWAVTKGPSYVPADKRLAVQVEDHPIEYGGFEGIIPQGQYGGGTVMLWDTGTWEPQPGHTDVDTGLREGNLKFTLHGTKMKGNWALIRMHGKAANASKPNWLLIKEHDDFEHSPNEEPITESAPNSALTGRTIDQIAASKDHIWNSKSANPDPAKPGTPSSRAASPRAKVGEAPQKSTASNQPILVPPHTPKEKLPTFIAPQLAQLATTPPATIGWLHELKLDGYRIQARKDGTRIQLLTRTGLDWTHRMQSIAAHLAALPAQSAILDGEVVVLAPNGTTSFADLQSAFQNGANKPLTYFVFDLLHLNGHNLRTLPLIQRKTLLAQLLHNAGESIRLSEHIESNGEVFFHKACEFHAEGIVSKRATASYTSGRGSSWLKLKCIREQEFVIGGFALPSKGHTGIHGIGALLLGYYESTSANTPAKKSAANKLIYVGRAGTGFTQKTHRILRDQLDSLRTKTTPFHDPPAEARRGAIWVKPQLVAQVHFTTWTADNLIRQASFKGLREDKPAAEVHREDPTTPPTPRGTRKSATHATHTAVAAKSIPTNNQQQTTNNKQPPHHAPVRLTHPDKILDIPSHLTKQQLADYYWAIAPHILPHIANRPLSLVRCPEGSDKPCFFQRHATATLPPGIEAIDIPDKKTGKLEPYITLSTPEALAGLAQMGVLEIHPWGSRNQDLEHPDRIIIDFDPDPAPPWPTLAAAAAEARNRLKKLGLESFLKTTGGKGLHVVVPIQPEHDWPTVKQFAHTLVLQMEKDNPALYLTKMTRSARTGRIYLDYLRNERSATAVAPYSPRASPGAPVSLPLSWSDLKLPDRPIFRVIDFADWHHRLSRDPWKNLLTTRQTLNPT